MIGRNVALAQRLAAILESPASQIPPASMAILAQTMAETTAKLAVMADATGQPKVARMLRVHAAASTNTVNIVTRGRGAADHAWASTTSINSVFVYDGACSRAASDPRTDFHEVASLCHAHGRVLDAMAGYARRGVDAGLWEDADAAPDVLRADADSFKCAVREIEHASLNTLIRPPAPQRRTAMPATDHETTRQEAQRWDL